MYYGYPYTVYRIQFQSGPVPRIHSVGTDANRH